MLEKMHSIVSIIFTISAVFTAIIIHKSNKESWLSKRKTKNRIIMSAILCTLASIQLIIGVILNYSVVMLVGNILCVILWGIVTIVFSKNLKMIEQVYLNHNRGKVKTTSDRIKIKNIQDK